MAEYFEQVLNVAYDREANINGVVNWLPTMLGDLNGRAISLVEVSELNEIWQGSRAGWISS